MPLIVRDISRTSSPLKMRLKPHEMSDVIIEKNAIHAIAARGFVVMPATFLMTQ